MQSEHSELSLTYGEYDQTAFALSVTNRDAPDYT